MAAKGIKEIYLKEEDYKVIRDFANRTKPAGCKPKRNSELVKEAFKIAFGVEFPSDAVRKQ
jgi:hypothetical protein